MSNPIDMGDVANPGCCFQSETFGTVFSPKPLRCFSGRKPRAKRASQRCWTISNRESIHVSRARKTKITKTLLNSKEKNSKINKNQKQKNAFFFQKSKKSLKFCVFFQKSLIFCVFFSKITKISKFLRFFFQKSKNYILMLCFLK